MSPLIDRFGRRFPYLRLSLIEACNFSCNYCLPNGYSPRPGVPEPLTVEEIARLLQAFAGVGLRKLRLTGGEPTLRRDLLEIMRSAKSVPGLETLAMTSNGVLLSKKVRDWRAAGLDALNISIDSLRRERFAKITGHDRLDDLLAGMETARTLGFKALKINAVLLRDGNDDELPQWLDYLRERRVGLRFIELMQTGSNAEYFRKHHLGAEHIEAPLRAGGWSLLPRAADAGPAREYMHPDYAGRIGVIAPYSKDFCASCNRLRVTAWGDLRLCLFGNVGIPLRPLLQDEAQQAELQAAIASQLGLKAIGHRLQEGETGLTPHLASVGG